MAKKSSRGVVKKLLKLETAIQAAIQKGQSRAYSRLMGVKRTLLKKLLECE